MHPAWIVSKIDWIKLDSQGSSWTSSLNPRVCHAGWSQDKATQGKQNKFAAKFCTVELSNFAR